MMTDGDIADLLRKRWRGEKCTYRNLATDYGVHQMDVWRAVHNGYVSPQLRRVFNPPRQREKTLAIRGDDVYERFMQAREVVGGTHADLLHLLLDAANVPRESE